MKKVTSKYRKKFKLRKGDEVMVMVGRSKGEIGTIDQIDYKEDKIYLAGKNLIKRHQKPNLQNQEGGIIEVPAPIHISNVMLVDSKAGGKPTRVGYKIEGDVKSRIAKKSGSVVTTAVAE